MSYTTVHRCRICGTSQLNSILHLGDQALTGIFPRSRDERVETGPVELVQCDSSAGGCGLVQLRQSYDPDAMYGENYGYRSGLNQSMVRHLAHRVETALAIAKPDAGDLILDIGSNDATTLRAYPPGKYELAGMDPTGKKFARYYPAHVTLIPEFFSADEFRRAFPKKRAKIVTSLAMFYDLESPQEFMREVHEVLADDGVWVFEQSYLPSMLSRLAYDTICHEHLSYYALRQIQWMTNRCGFKIIAVELNDTNGGSFCVTVAKSSSSHEAARARVDELLAAEETAGLDTPAPFAEFRVAVRRHRDQLCEFVRSETALGKSVFGYGASTKGNVLLQYCNFTAADIKAIAEVNEEKFGCVTPQTLIPICSEAEVRRLRPDYLLVLPWHFRNGIVQREAAYLADGGKLVFPLPAFEVVEAHKAVRTAA
ncbi:MAG TPA: class I SAM-dependent methyltransferase [Planctomycetaceae bacterium]|nr:class I SAM-dependent methyltransferase [Planctomycetaceae bacterium]